MSEEVQTVVEAESVTIPKLAYDQLIHCQQFQEQMSELNERVEQAKSAWEDAKGNASAAKKRYESYVEELRDAIEDASSGQQRLPFTDSENAGQSEDTVGAEADAEGGEEQIDYQMDVGKLDLSKALVDSLRGAGILTLDNAIDAVNGEFEPLGEKGLEGLSGWGAGRILKLKQAIEKVTPAFSEAEVDLGELLGTDELHLVRVVGDANILRTAGLEANMAYHAKIEGDHATVYSEQVGTITLMEGEWEYFENEAAEAEVTTVSQEEEYQDVDSEGVAV